MPFPDLQNLAGRIDTGDADSETSRALVVFNTTGKALTGVAVHEASMAWPVNALVPFIAVTDTNGSPVASDIPNLAEGPDPGGRADHRLLAFQLRFAVQDVPARGWQTYLVFMAGDAVDETAAPEPQGLDTETPGLVVVETSRHQGDLPPVGTF